MPGDPVLAQLARPDEAVRQIIFARLRREPDWDQLDPNGDGCGPYVESAGPQPSARQVLVFAAE